MKRASAPNVHNYGIKKRNICKNHEEYLAEQNCNQMRVERVQGVFCQQLDLGELVSDCTELKVIIQCSDLWLLCGAKMSLSAQIVQEPAKIVLGIQESSVLDNLKLHREMKAWWANSVHHSRGAARSFPSSERSGGLAKADPLHQLVWLFFSSPSTRPKVKRGWDSESRTLPSISREWAVQGGVSQNCPTSAF